jgi:gentisate 1,2-dioxygenase
VPAAVGLLFSGIQVMKAGECASAHRHMASALRFIMEGRGAYTVVDGERLSLEANDFVLTPNGTWHEHGVDESGTTCIWQDGLDIPLMNALDANFYAVHPELRQKTNRSDASPRLHGAGFLQPAGLRRGWDKPHSPLLKFEWAPTYDALARAAGASDGSPYDGILMDYVNPLTGGPVMPTMGARLDLVTETKPIRHTGSQIFQVATGRGWSEVGGQRFEWEEKDIFCVPSWTKYRHGAHGEAVLFSFNDIPAMKALSLYRESHD